MQPSASAVCLLVFLMFYFIKQGTQRKAIMDSFMAAQKYCLLATCRRRFLLQYFGEERNTDCGMFFLFFNIYFLSILILQLNLLGYEVSCNLTSTAGIVL